MNQVDRRSSDEEDTLAWIIDGNRVSLGDLTGLTLGDFHVEQLLGRGGMGEVYMATQTSLNRPVALKVLRPDFLLKPVYVERFKSEALAVAKLNHPNIVHVYAIGNVGDVHFIAMEYVEGTNLREYLRKKGALELPLVLSIMKQTAQAIGAAGEAGLVHRDIKPENILITKRGRVKVADFGLCRDQSVEAMSMTQSGVTMGTPLYMSPEQAQGHPVDHRSDLYSLGVTYYFMIAGEPPFRADTAVALALKHVREIPRSLLNYRPDLPLEIDRLVMKLMAKDPADRYQSAAMMLADLSKLRDVFQVGSAGLAEPAEVPSVRTEDLAPTTSNHDLAVRAPDRGPVVAVSPRPVAAPERPARVATIPAPKPSASPDAEPRIAQPARFSALVAMAAVATGLFAGALAGWSARAPDIQSNATEPAAKLPALWVEPRWNAVAKQASAEDQMRYALLRAPIDEWAAAWLAVPGYYQHSRELVSKAYTQLARVWYRLDDVGALEILASELAAWEKAQARDKDLAAFIKTAIDMRTGDLKAVAESFGKLTPDGLRVMDDPTLLALRLEVCSDALQVAQKSGNQTLAEPLRKALRTLAWRLDRLEVVDPAPANSKRANPARKAESHSNG
ncbi:MAG: protein kinase domain-containing protein [Isosphaeraceae bacterium]